jgi:hypothetical protein
VIRLDERGIAIVMAMFMTLIVSAVAAGMTFLARTETMATQSYTTMAQARYGAESGLAAATHYLLSSPYTTNLNTAGDPLTNYDTTGSPVRLAGGGSAPVLLSTDPNASTYPIAAVVQAFGQAASGTLTVSNGTVAYGARARLLAMRTLNDMSAGTRILQTWEITGVGRRTGSGSADVEVVAVIERQTVPFFRYAAFAVDSGCSALRFAGGAITRSYDSAALVNGNPAPSLDTGHVGTNGNLTLEGSNTQIYGSLSTPRAGVGSCTANNVTANTIQGSGATVHGGLIELPQVVEYPPPPIPSGVPTTTVTMDNSFNCSGYASCTKSGSTIAINATAGVPYVMGNVTVSGGNELVLGAGVYHLNSITVQGNNTSLRAAGNGPVIIHIAGGGSVTTPIYLAGNSISNPTFRPENLQLLYGGTKPTYIAGSTQTAALVYAPLSNLELAGNSEFFGSFIGAKVDVSGGGRLTYDTNLQTSMPTAGNPVMSTFTWRSF